MSNRKTNGHSKPEDFLLPEFEEHELPSGLHAKLLPASVDMWISYGNLPAIARAETLAEQEGRPVSAEDYSPEMTLAWEHHKICYLFIEPKFSTKGEPGTLHPSRLRREDRLWLGQYIEKFQKAGGGAGLQKFRGDKGEPDRAAQGGEGVRESAE